jgi:rubrerythrin
MKGRFLWLALILVAGATMAFAGCKQKPKEAAEGKVPPAKEEPTTGEEKTASAFVWTCGMAGHAEFAPGDEPADGKCPQCGMKLKKKEVPPE